MAEKLTPEQLQAVQDRGGRLLVSAAAGSGKTKVLVDRLMGYLLDPVDPANIDDFLMITYTKAAASELRAKIASKVFSALLQPHHPLEHRQQIPTEHEPENIGHRQACDDLPTTPDLPAPMRTHKAAFADPNH